MSLLNAFTGGPNNQLINGEIVDINTVAGDLSADLWGLKWGDQAKRRNEGSHLSRVSGDGFNYDLQTKGGVEMFVADLQDGVLDGQFGPSNGSVVFSEGKLIVNGGETEYKLADPKDYAKFRKDNADGTLDGNGARPRSTESNAGSPPPDEQPSGSGSNGNTSGTGGTGSSAGSTPPGGSAAPGQAGSTAREKYEAGMAAIAGKGGRELTDLMMNGGLPDAVLDDPNVMMVVQMKVQQFQRAMQMITDMLKANHELQMAIIRNIK